MTLAVIERKEDPCAINCESLNGECWQDVCSVVISSTQTTQSSIHPQVKLFQPVISTGLNNNNNNNLLPSSSSLRRGRIFLSTTTRTQKCLCVVCGGDNNFGNCVSGANGAFWGEPQRPPVGLARWLSDCSIIRQPHNQFHCLRRRQIHVWL